MNIEVDQSNKVEQTEKDTVLALANGINFALLVKSKSKKSIQEEFRLRGEPRNFIIFTFSLLLVILLKKAKPVGVVTVDLEYADKERIIRERLTQYSRQLGFEYDWSLIAFKRVGKSSPAHKLAGKVSAGKQRPSFVVSEEKLLNLLFLKKKKTGRQKRPRSV